MENLGRGWSLREPPRGFDMPVDLTSIRTQSWASPQSSWWFLTSSQVAWLLLVQAPHLGTMVLDQLPHRVAGREPAVGISHTWVSLTHRGTNCETPWKCLTHSKRHTAHRWMSDSHHPQSCWEEEGHMANTVCDPEAAAAKACLCSTHRLESLSANPGRDAHFPWQCPPCAPFSSHR